MPNEGLTPAINRKEVVVALKGMKQGKAMGPDGIPVEVWKSLGEEGVDMLLDLLQKIFELEKMPEEWRDSVIVSIFKAWHHTRPLTHLPKPLYEDARKTLLSKQPSEEAAWDELGRVPPHHEDDGDSTMSLRG